MNQDQWRYCCPEGHVTVRRCLRQGGYRCLTCRRSYDTDPIDLKDVSRDDLPDGELLPTTGGTYDPTNES